MLASKGSSCGRANYRLAEQTTANKPPRAVSPNATSIETAPPSLSRPLRAPARLFSVSFGRPSDPTW
eukprot:7298401-Pyramimonas_sp.AAC.1